MLLEIAHITASAQPNQEVTHRKVSALGRCVAVILLSRIENWLVNYSFNGITLTKYMVAVRNVSSDE